ncbi:purine/pyrimidine permease [Bacillus sp. SJS]|uniref:purine/pyrimidine permease n=1 Tax=Bacillus sp. SJS TaxID=1423321 RepID=UPI0004DD4425|nr:purine/pyrimidine permease [Bacillus sp. SJS]KZZ83783.1 purine permease [Bacillus sp. SJS]
MKLLLSALQWVFFIIASTIVVPIAIGQLYQLDGSQTAILIQSTLFVLGLAGLMQVLFGHKLPINEGPAGLWWGVYSIYAGLSSTLFASYIDTLQNLQGALLMSGGFFLLFAIFGLIDKLAKLFTPLVTGAYLLLLVFQLSGSIVKGIMGVGYRGSKVDPAVFAAAAAILLFTFFLSRMKRQFFKQYSILIGLLAGWGVFALLGLAKPVKGTTDWFSLPVLFPFGAPVFNAGMIVTAFFITLLLIANMLASIKVAEQAVKALNKDEKDEHGRGRRAGIFAGISHGISGLTGAVGPVPISGAAGFITTTGNGARLPFIIANLLVIALSMIPLVLNLFAALPAPVGFAVQFVVFSGMIGMALRQLNETADKDRMLYTIGIALLTGTGAMYVPPAAFEGFPPVLISIFNNGLILGTIIAIIVDQLTMRFGKKA